MLNAAFGGGMSSRLFQEVREKRGLAYSVYSFAAQYADTGSWSASTPAACPQGVDDVLAICRDELERVVDGGLTDAELERGKGQLRGSLVLGLEDTVLPMSRLGKSELTTASCTGRRGHPPRRRRHPRRHPRDRRRVLLTGPRPWP